MALLGRTKIRLGSGLGVEPEGHRIRNGLGCKWDRAELENFDYYIPLNKHFVQQSFLFTLDKIDQFYNYYKR